MSIHVTIENLSKAFGPILAVDRVSFSIQQGDVLGFLGPNGAGKSTTMKMITGFLTPTSGTVSINGHDIQDQALEAKRNIGYLPEGAPAYQDMTPEGFLTFIAQMRGYRGTEVQRRVSDTVEKVNLSSVLDQRIETLSKGFKRRVGLAQAILHDPQVLVLDEPTDGLDPNQKHEVRSLITTMAREKAIILSTHILEEVHAVCTRAIIIANGKVVVDGTPEDLEAKSGRHHAVILTVQNGLQVKVPETLTDLPGVKSVESLEGEGGPLRYRVIPQDGHSILHAVSQTAHTYQWQVVELYVERSHLDEVFRFLTMPTQELS